MKRIFYMVKKNLLCNSVLFITVMACNFLSALISLLAPYLTAYYIDQVLAARNQALLYKVLLAIAGCAFLGKLIAYFSQINTVKLHSNVSFAFNLNIIDHVQKLPLLYFEKINTVYLSKRINDDAQDIVAFLLDNIMNFCINFITFICVVGIMYEYSVVLTSLLAIIIAIYLSLYKSFRKIIFTWLYKRKEQQNIFFAKLSEQLDKIKFIKINALENYLRKGLFSKFHDLLEICIYHAKINWMFFTSGEIVKHFATICILLIGGMRVINGGLSIGQFVAINSYFAIGMGCVDYFLSMGSYWQSARVSFERVEEILREPIEETGTVKLNDVEQIDFDDVNFSYDADRPLFRNFSYSFKKGHIYCIIGENGSGKSTLINMLIGLYMPTSGSIKYNDILLSDIDVHHLRSELVAFSEQEPMLLSDTLENNLLAGHAIGNRDMFFYWLNRLDMGAFINAFSEGVNRFIDSTVDNVSGGEKQKLSQIRTFLKDAPVIILDEPTSSLDDLSISRLKDVLLDLKGDKIIITITHHAFFQSIADEIIDIRECVC